MTIVVERPPTEAELVATVTRAAAAGRRVRAVGQARPVPKLSGARPGGDEVVIDLSAYRRLLRVDREGGQATVQAGIQLHALGVALGSWGLSLENGGRDPLQSLGAAISLGAHGTGSRYGGLATQVRAMRLVIPDGTVVTCSGQEEPEIFDAARVGLGALGVISTVTLDCRPGFNLRATVASVELSEALACFDAYAEGNDHVELSWLSGRTRARVTTANRTDEPANGAAIDRSYRWWNRRRIWPPRVEYSVPRCDSATALRRARELSAGRRSALPFPIEVSVTAGDDIALSPAQGRPSVFIAGLGGLDGRPAWGSAHGLSVAALRALYPRWDDWHAVRDRLDPDRRFAQRSGQG